jgi:hypothetical protein
MIRQTNLEIRAEIFGSLVTLPTRAVQIFDEAEGHIKEPPALADRTL